MTKVIKLKKEKPAYLKGAMKVADDLDKQIEESKKNADHIIAGTEGAYKKKDEESLNTYLEKFKKYKEDYIAKNSLESMVYENGSALALLYKEIKNE